MKLLPLVSLLAIAHSQESVDDFETERDLFYYNNPSMNPYNGLYPSNSAYLPDLNLRYNTPSSNAFLQNSSNYNQAMNTLGRINPNIHNTNVLSNSNNAYGGDATGGLAIGGNGGDARGGNSSGGDAISSANGGHNIVYQTANGGPVYIGPVYGAPAYGGSSNGGFAVAGSGNAQGGNANGGHALRRKLRGADKDTAITGNSMVSPLLTFATYGGAPLYVSNAPSSQYYLPQYVRIPLSNASYEYMTSLTNAMERHMNSMNHAAMLREGMPKGPQAEGNISSYISQTIIMPPPLESPFLTDNGEQALPNLVKPDVCPPGSFLHDFQCVTCPEGFSYVDSGCKKV